MVFIRLIGSLSGSIHPFACPRSEALQVIIPRTRILRLHAPLPPAVGDGKLQACTLLTRMLLNALSIASMVKQNIVFAIGIKLLMLLLGALGAVNMWAAVFADVGVTILAILNALRGIRVRNALKQ